jgi:hypothetical protein
MRVQPYRRHKWLPDHARQGTSAAMAILVIHDDGGDVNADVHHVSDQTNGCEVEMRVLQWQWNQRGHAESLPLGRAIEPAPEMQRQAASTVFSIPHPMLRLGFVQYVAEHVDSKFWR